ncbi:MAG: hypothetical protein GWP59_03070 [Chlamydiales bacterium]|nr:hypothetical protein [Chlamydiales bacterium]
MRVANLLKLVRVRETVFSLPFMFMGALLPFADPSFSLETPPLILFSLIFLAGFLARNAAMCFNRVIDRKIDAENPRTAHRMLASGKEDYRSVFTMAWAFSFLFVLLCGVINSTCFLLSPFIISLIFAYSFCKRFTVWGHAVLALVHFFGPVMAYIAISSEVAAPAFLLGGAVFTWIFGMDLIYQTQDMEHDARHGIWNLGVLIGRESSYYVAAMMHLLTLNFLVLVGLSANLALPYYVGVFATLLSFLVSYRLLYKKGLKEINEIFFVSNARISLILLACTVVSILWTV